MKKLLALIILTAFFANTTIVSAWAKSCIIEEPSMAKESNMPPCHEPMDIDTEKETSKHCDGICLCLHVSATQTPTLNDVATMNHGVYKQNMVSISQDSIKSTSYKPPRRPPKINA